MKTIQSKSESTTKFIHRDRSETSIKLLPSGSYLAGEDGAKFENRNKYSIVISSSTGCVMECDFCHLTQKEMSHKNLTNEQIVSNIQAAILHQYLEDKSIQDKFVKICWMGMGEPIIKHESIAKVTLEILDWIMENNMAKGLDGVDLSTVLPRVNNGWVESFRKLNKDLEKYPVNPNNNIVPNSDSRLSNLKNYKDRSLFRLFYSLHATDQDIRRSMIPNSMGIDLAFRKLDDFHKETGINVVVHYMFIHGVNDNEEQVERLISRLNQYDYMELRILRFNSANLLKQRESDDFNSITLRLSSEVSKFKVQYSAGSHILSACGQFVAS